MKSRLSTSWNPWRNWLLLVITIVIWGVTDVRHRARIDPDNALAHKTDFTVYTEAGAAFFDGRMPYEVTNSRGWHYLYPPLFAMSVAPLSLLDTQSQAIVWYVISVAACFGCWAECKRLTRALGGPAKHWWSQMNGAYADQPNDFERDTSTSTIAGKLPNWLCWLALATVALPVLNCLQRGQVGVVIVYLLLLGTRLALTSCSWVGALTAGIVLSLPIAIKLTPLLPVGLLLIEFAVLAFYARRSYSCQIGKIAVFNAVISRALIFGGGQALGLLLFLIVVPGLAIGQQQNFGHLQTWIARVAVNEDVGKDNDFNTRSKRNQSLANAVERLGNYFAYVTDKGPNDRLVDFPETTGAAMPMDRPEVRTATKIIAATLVFLLLVGAWRVCRLGDIVGLIAFFGLACTATLLVSPLSWGHHYVMLLPAAIFVPYWHLQRSNLTTARWLAGSLCGLTLTHYLLMDVAGRLGVLGLGTTVWFVAAVTSIAWPRTAAALAPQQQPATDMIQNSGDSVISPRLCRGIG